MKTSDIRPQVRTRIADELDRIESEEQVRILFACESGSRAWGFPSADSDYDVRFFYIRPTSWYLSIQKRRDVIERMIGEELDLVGWDLPKALHLFGKSNPPLLEWLQSPIVYRERGKLAGRLRERMPSFYSPGACLYHYLHMARSNYREYLRGDTVWLKKYLYVLRPVLSCLWIEAGFGPVPMFMGTLVDRLVGDPDIKEAIGKLLAEKLAGQELGRGRCIRPISDFLDRELIRLSAIQPPRASEKDAASLDQIFLETLIEINGPMLTLPGKELLE